MRQLVFSTVALSVIVGGAPGARAEERRLYITTAECAGSPNAPACQGVGTICVSRDGSRIRGVVERLSEAQRKHKIPSGLRFDLSASDLKGRYISAYPGGDRCKNNLHEFPAAGSFGGGNGTGKYVEFSFPYRQFNLDTCELAGEPSDPKTRLYEVTDGSTCGARRKTTEVSCPSGSRRVAVQLVGAETGRFQGLAITSELDESRTVLSPAALERAAKALGANGTPIFTWRNGAGETRAAYVETVIETACGAKTTDTGVGAASMKMILRKAAEDWIRDYAESRCKSDPSCVKSLDVSAGPGIRG